MQLKFKPNLGLSLVELLISMVVSLIVITAAVALLTVNTHFGTKQLQQDFLQAKLFAIALIINDEIRRAGFCFNCTYHNPYQLYDKDNNHASILIDDSATQSSGSCIRFAYNHDKREKPSSVNKDDAKGFRLGKDANGKAVIEIYENWNGLTNWHCDSAAGYSGYWQDMTLDNMVLEEFSFSRRALIAGENRLQQIRLQISASIRGNSEIKEKVTIDVNVANVDG